MTFSITTNDGITIDNIPDDVAPDSEVLRNRVTELRQQRDKPPSEAGFIETLQGEAELATTVATSAVLEPIAGVAGIVQSLNPFAEPGAGARAVEAVQGLAFKPGTTGFFFFL